VWSISSSKGSVNLGQLTFRIIAGYTTSPLLRLIQLWQNFQETALSPGAQRYPRYPQEVEQAGRESPCPLFKAGSMKMFFRFTQHGSLQLNKVSLNFPTGVFVVGQSGAGKSTLMKPYPAFMSWSLVEF